MLDKSKAVYCNVFGVKCTPKERVTFGKEFKDKSDSLGLFTHGYMIDPGGKHLIWLTVFSNEEGKGKDIIPLVNELNARSVSKAKPVFDARGEFIHDPKYL
jgi:hypothetical protein